MTTKSVNFVPATVLFMDLKLAWDEFVDYANEVTWGDVAHSLVKPSQVVEILKKAYKAHNYHDDGDDQIERVLGRLQLIKEDTFIDLET